MMSDHQNIEYRLAELADDIDWPDVDVTGGVRQRIRAEPSSARRPTMGWKAAVAALAALVVILAVPVGRQAIADLLGVAGIEVAFTDQAHDTDSIQLDLGEPVSLQDTTERSTFPISLPALAEVGTPTAIYLEEGPPTVVHATWEAGPDLPEVAVTGIGLLLTQFESGTEQTVFSKELSDSTSVEVTAVGDDPALWIEGAPHQLTYRPANGIQTREVSRLAANVLIWESNGITYRLESDIDLQPALRIAQALSPATP